MIKEHTRAKLSGELLHTKHAFPPNSLGHCGPDVRGRIEEYLHSQTGGDNLLPVLTKFEAAYPFVKMIAKSTGREPFDYEVPEAYWLGNSLLNHVKADEFFEFTLQGLAPSRKMAGKKDGISKEQAKVMFKELGPTAKPHHTFYVLGMFARSSETAGTKDKLLELMDSCRISWGNVIEVKEKELIVERNPLRIEEKHLTLAKSVRRKVSYDSEIPPFGTIRKGDWVSLHWNFASEKLNLTQLRNLKMFTSQDIRTTNLYVDLLQNSKH